LKLKAAFSFFASFSEAGFPRTKCELNPLPSSSSYRRVSLNYAIS